MNYLFIGGSADGRWLALRYETERFEMLKYPELKFIPDYEPLLEHSVVFEKDVYLLEKFRGQNKEVRIFRHNSISIDEMVLMLVNNYRPE